jgi:hypothetical protein
MPSSETERLYLDIWWVKGDLAGEFGISCWGLPKSSVLAETHSINRMVLRHETQMVLTSWYASYICEILNQSWSPILIIDWSSPAIGSLPPRKQASIGGKSTFDYFPQHYQLISISNKQPYPFPRPLLSGCYGRPLYLSVGWPCLCKMIVWLGCGLDNIGSMSLLGDEVIELLFGNDTIAIGISTLNHFLEDGIISKLS